MENTTSASKSDELATPAEGGRDAEATEAQVPAGPAQQDGAAQARPKKPTLDIPAILLEGDNPPSPPESGPGRRYALGPTPPLKPAEQVESLGELPEAYGTRRLMLASRDPHWVYAHWDLTREQQRHCNQISADGRLILRIRSDSLAGERVTEVQVHPESRHWFVHVGRGGRGYIAELGCTDTHGKWVSFAVSGVTFTPPDAMSGDTSVQFATVLPNIPLSKRAETTERRWAENVPQVGVHEQSPAGGHVELQGIPGPGAPSWTPEQERALEAAVSLGPVCRGQMSSLEIAGFSYREMPPQFSSMAAAQIAPPFAAPPTLSSPHGGGAQPRSFRFDVNVELIIYGGTEPNAIVTLGGRRIQLRPDGTFSVRFALPDGQYPLPVVATAADGDDTRWANLHFARNSQYVGEVGVHPQDATLRPPPESV